MQRIHARIMANSETEDLVVRAWGQDGLTSIRLPKKLAIPLKVGEVVRLVLESDVVVAIARVGGPQAGRWDAEGDGMRWAKASAPIGRLTLLRRRHEIVRAIREDLYDAGFVEIQAPLLVRGGCPDLFIESFRVDDRYLVTSTEYQIKRMIAGGFDRIFTLTQNFRRGDMGPLHNPEFTMLEWARAFESLETIEDDAVRFIRRAFQRSAPTESHLRYHERAIDILSTPWERVSVRDAIRKHLGVEIAPDFSLASMSDGCARASVEVPASVRDDAHDLVSYLLVLLQPHLGWERPTFLREWPSFMTSSAETVPGAPFLAERSELFIAGIEVADGFPSLRDPEAQNASFTRENRRRQGANKEPVELDERYLAALDQGLPPGAGMALGLDRLVMLLTGQTDIRSVLAFAWDEL